MDCPCIFVLDIIGNKRPDNPECQTCSLAIFRDSRGTGVLPNCKFGTPDVRF
ncbi:Uncharacterized protein dnm_014770 [Desulfonema magnum]|uniref:Uncharacterized protein n=1 Tax=Desulfonema magnum TaxID=45655 RepID=A0A975GL49_9BACT|nr:Uncharacterized protein dnm_014770 [Desulfonema magnum]